MWPQYERSETFLKITVCLSSDSVYVLLNVKCDECNANADVKVSTRFEAKIDWPTIHHEAFARNPSFKNPRVSVHI